MKLSEYRGEQALELLADIVEPAAAIISDKEIAKLAKSGAERIKLVKPIIKNHKKEVIEILAILDGEDPKQYADKVNVFTLPTKLLDILNDPELTNLFTLQGQKMDEESSGSATESTEANEQ